MFVLRYGNGENSSSTERLLQDENKNISAPIRDVRIAPSGHEISINGSNVSEQTKVETCENEFNLSY